MKKTIIFLVILVLTAITKLAVVKIYNSINTPENAIAQYELANSFDDGGSAELDYKRAAELFKLSADQGYADAQNALGLMYYYGQGVEENNVKAAESYEKAAAQGNKYAQYNLAEMYVDELGVKQDYKVAAELYQKAVDQEYAPAQYSFGLMFEYGNGVKKNNKKAVELYQKAANQNDNDALYRLATIYKEGKIVELNYSKAIALYKKISEPDSYGVFEELAVFYDEGKGVTQDHDAADELYKKASKLQYDNAREGLSAGNKDILKLGKSALRLASTARKTASFFGGKPFVLTTFEWPKTKGLPLSFIGQLDLSEINKSKVPWLPNTGRLLFFYDIADQPWGIYPIDQKASVVLYDQGMGELHVQEFPAGLNSEAAIQPRKYLRAEGLISYPTANRTNRISFSSNDDYESYYTFLDYYYVDPRHQVTGYPSAIQSDTMEEDCQKIDLANTSRKAQKDDWKMLLQFDTDDDIDVMWGDSGRLYFWIRESDAQKQNFAHTCVIVQSY